MKLFLNKYCNDTFNDNYTNNMILNNLDSLDSIDVFFEKTKFKRDPCSFTLLNESIDFRLELFKYFSNLSFDVKNNLSETETNSLFKFLKKKPFKVIDADKNVGLAIISNELHDNLVLNHLNNCETYSFINDFNLNDIVTNINDSLLDLKISKHISNKLYSKLVISDSLNKVGKFRILAKLHKDKFGIRPIINCKNNFTSLISLLIDLILKPLVKAMPSFLQDSQHLLQDALNLSINYDINDFRLISADFELCYSF